MKCSRNIGTLDRMIRLGVALLLFILAFLRSSWGLYGVGVFVLFEAVIGWCILYQILGKSSCPTSKSK
jgi:hypothetical protein